MIYEYGFSDQIAGENISIEIWKGKGISDGDSVQISWKGSIQVPLKKWEIYLERFKKGEKFNISETCKSCDGLVIIQSMSFLSGDTHGVCRFFGTGDLKFNGESIL